MDVLHELSAEIRRINECQYTPSLKRLHELVIDANVWLLHRWARNNPCQINSLAASVLEGLELWPFALDLLRMLAWIPSFRDAALQQRPLLLSTFLLEATESDSGFEKFASVCVSLLSAPLEAAIPSSIPAFLESLLENAIRSLSPETIRPVYQILSGLGPSYLEDLAPEVLTRFQEQSDEVLKKFDATDPFGPLICLAVLAQFASRSSARTGGGISAKNVAIAGDAVLAEPADYFRPARRYFVGKKAPTTLNLVVYRVISACSANSALDLNGALETLSLSECIVDALCSQDKRAWIANNTGKTKKLYEKTLRPNIDSSLQAAAINFAVALCDGQELPGELKSTYEKMTLTLGSAILASRPLAHCIGLYDPATFSESLSRLLRVACEDRSPSSERLIKLDNALQIVSAMTAATYSGEHLSQAILHATSSGLLYQFATQEPPGLDSNGGHCPKDVCRSIYLDTMMQLQQRLVVTILSMMLRLQSSSQDSHGIAIILLEKQTQLFKTAMPCPNFARYKPVPNQSAPSLFEASSTPGMNTISHNWKGNLVCELSRNASRVQESVTRIVGEICRDLELRCEEAERPYWEEQNKTRTLEAKLDASRAEVAQLEVKLQGQSSSLDDLKIEKETLSDIIKALQQRLEAQARQLEEVRSEFDYAKEASERAAQAAIETSRDQDMAYLATLTGKEEVLEEQAIKLTASENRISDLEDQVTKLTAREVNHSETVRKNETRLRELTEEIITANNLVATKQYEIICLTESQVAATASKEEAASRAQQVSDHKDFTISDLRSKLDSANIKLEELKREHDMYATMKDAEMLRLEDKQKTSCERLQAELEDVRNGAAIAHEDDLSQIFSLRSRVKKLSKEREEQGTKLAEAQELGRRFMAVMGSTTNQAGNPRTKTPCLAAGVVDALPEDIGSPENPATRGNPATPSGSGTSSLSGATPKRNKTRRSPKARKTEGPTDFRPIVIIKPKRRHTMKSGRTPLADRPSMHNQTIFSPTQRISLEKSPNKVVDAEILQENREVQGWNSDDESFGGRDIFTSTDQRQLSALRQPPETPHIPRHSFEETTTEF